MIFDTRTRDFLDYLFEQYGLQETAVAGTHDNSLFHDIQSTDQISDYID